MALGKAVSYANRIKINEPTDQSGNVLVNLAVPLPAGNNTIGNIGSIGSLGSITGALPAGSNTIGNIGQIINPLPYQNPTSINIISLSAPSANYSAAIANPGVNAYNFVIIYNPNTNTIYIGNSSTQPIPIVSGGSLSLDANLAPINMSTIYWLGPNAGNQVVVMYA